MLLQKYMQGNVKEISFQEDLNILIFLLPADEIALFCFYWCCIHSMVVSYRKVSDSPHKIKSEVYFTERNEREL